jgi:hypothetical protein
LISTPLSSLSELGKSAAIYTRSRAARQQPEAIQIPGSAGSKADPQAAPGKAYSAGEQQYLKALTSRAPEGHVILLDIRTQSMSF